MHGVEESDTTEGGTELNGTVLLHAHSHTMQQQICKINYLFYYDNLFLCY